MQVDNPLTTQFTSIYDLFDLINCTARDFLAITNVSPTLFTEIERTLELTSLTCSLQRSRPSPTADSSRHYRIRKKQEK
jgi:hypothetical protein